MSASNKPKYAACSPNGWLQAWTTNPLFTSPFMPLSSFFSCASSSNRDNTAPSLPRFLPLPQKSLHPDQPLFLLPCPKRSRLFTARCLFYLTQGKDKSQLPAVLFLFLILLVHLSSQPLLPLFLLRDKGKHLRMSQILNSATTRKKPSNHTQGRNKDPLLPTNITSSISSYPESKSNLLQIL